MPPDEIVDWLLPDKPSRVVDLAAGTGAMSRQLERRVGEIVAVEPDGRMLSVLMRRSPAVRAVSGRAEALPLQDEVADAVVISSAWHWMGPDVAVPEIARVLRDGGRFGVVWNGRDHRNPLMQELAGAAMANPSRRDRQRWGERLRALALPQGSPFGEVESRLLPFTVSMSVDELAGSLGTYSRAQEAPGGVEGTVARAREFLTQRFGADARLDVPMGSRAFRCQRLSRP
jgi:SAM-dependent methyltransferase